MKPFLVHLFAVALLASASQAAEATTLFNNDFSVGLGPVEAVTGNFAVGRGYVGHQNGYENNEHSTYSFAVDLGSSQSAYLDFDYAFHIESNYDLLHVLVGNDLVLGYTGGAQDHAHVALDSYTGPTTITFDFTSDGSITYEGVFLDNVAVTTADNAAPPISDVPEPASWALMVLGFGGVGAAMRSRRSVAAALV